MNRSPSSVCTTLLSSPSKSSAAIREQRVAVVGHRVDVPVDGDPDEGVDPADLAAALEQQPVGDDRREQVREVTGLPRLEVRELLGREPGDDLGDAGPR